MSRIAAIDARLMAARSGGDSTYWAGLVHGLARTGSDWRYLLFFNDETPPQIPDDPRFEAIRVPARSDRWWSMVAFPLAARRMGAHVIHTQYNLSPLAGERGVTLIHDVSFFIGPQWFGAKDRALLRRFVPGSARRAAQVLTVSETSAREIGRYIPAARGKLTVTPLALNPALTITPREQAVEVVREHLGIEGPYALSVSTRWPRKNMALAVGAMARLPETFPHQLVLTGKGDAPDHPRVRTTGYVEDGLLGPLYAAADLYLCPSHHEGFGLPLLEAFASGCPVLCSGGGALPEVAGGAAYVETDLTPETWTCRIEALLTDSSKVADMRRRGLERVHCFDWRETARRTLEAYAKVAP